MSKTKKTKKQTDAAVKLDQWLSDNKAERQWEISDAFTFTLTMYIVNAKCLIVQYFDNGVVCFMPDSLFTATQEWDSLFEKLNEFYL